MQRTQKFLDTRPHRDAGHQTEIIKRLAASAVQESKTPASAGVIVLDGPSTQVKSFYAKAHTVQDTAVYNEYTAGQAVAQSEKPSNAKASQIEQVCYSSSVMPDFNDILDLNPDEAAKQLLKNQGLKKTCCTVCGEPVQYTTACPCSLTSAQQVALKDAKRRFTTPS